MSTHPKHITLQRYFEDMQALLQQLDLTHIHCVVCLKRSGMFPGAYLSFQTRLPLFTTSELASIPNKFENIL
ncbi:MAG TPA: hypothetical protein VL947_03165, partial [Cytophagales bacterium]|nr:hypothetical protein [Cytophagales bacterium]